MTAGDQFGEPRLGNLDTVAAVHESVISSGPGAGMRAIDVSVWDGISVRIYPDRGLDLGQAWFSGIPLAWLSPVGEARPQRYLEGMAWNEAFMGGLMTTCGLRNVGKPSEGHGLHGNYAHLPAGEVTARRIADGGRVFVDVTGVVVDDAKPGPLRHRRTIRVHAGRGRLEVADTTENLGDETAAAPLLYHFNFGYPLWAPPAELALAAKRTVARDEASNASLDDWDRPPPVTESTERVLEHDLGGEDGRAAITNPELGLELTLSWDRSTLPHLNQWLDPNPGMSVLGIEPANCTTRGRAYERKRGSLPVIEPGARRTTTLAVAVEKL